jgi:hypothetical protein
MEEYISFHKIITQLQYFQEQNERLNSFGYGNLVDFGKNVSGTTVVYPFMFVIPQSIQYDENTTTYQLSILFADRLNETLDNEVDAISDMSLTARLFLSEIKRGTLQDYFDITLPQQGQPFLERFNDNVAGVALDANIIVYEDVNACPQYPTPTPSNTPNLTPTITPTNTPTNTVTPSITPTNTVTPSITPTQTPGQCREYEFQTTSGPAYITYNDCYGNPQIWNQPFGTTENICAIAGTVVLVSGFAIITNLGPCIPPTPTPTNTPTNTVTPTVTKTPGLTPTPSITPSATPASPNPRTLGALWWIDFTDSSTLTIDIPNQQVVTATDKVANIVFSADPGGPPYFPTGYLGLSGDVRTGGTQLKNQSGDYGSVSEYTWFGFIYDDVVSQRGGKIFVAAQEPGWPGGQAFSLMIDPNDVGYVWRFQNRTASGSNVQLNTPITYSAWTAIAMRSYYDGTNTQFEVWENGSIINSGNVAGNVYTSTDPIFSLMFDGGIDFNTEQFFFDRKLTNSEMAQMFNYLNNKY